MLLSVLSVDDKHTAFETVGSQVMVCQFVAMMEIIHPLLGFVKTGVFAPLAQVGFVFDPTFQ